MPDAGQIKVIGTNKMKTPTYPLVSADVYTCANTQITRGFTAAPDSLEWCFEKFPKIKEIANILGITGSESLWTAPNGPSGAGISGASYDSNSLYDIYLDYPSREMELVKQKMGNDWVGCYWAAPDSPFSVNCPDINSKYEAYLKLRLNIATFWNTPKETPVKRREFLDSLKYARKLDIVVSGDLNLKIGDVVYIKADNISGYPYNIGPSFVSGYYWILAVKHTFTNSGTHETLIRVSQILNTQYAGTPNNSSTTVGSSNGVFNVPGFIPPPGQGLFA